MRILALGGTKFVGRAFVEAALARGHEISVMHRGKTPLPEGWAVEEILGDRDGDLDALGDRSWDAVYDSCGYVPRVVRASAESLKARCRRYLFISSISVYDLELNLQRPRQPVETEEITDASYGPLKVECEDAVISVFGARATIVRPGLVVGPNDPTGRFCYWLNRFATYGTVLVPDIPDGPMQLIDARDLGAFCVTVLEKDLGGIFHAAGEVTTFDAMIAVCALLGGGEAVRVPPEVLETRGIRLGEDLPLMWSPEAAKLLGFKCEESLRVGLVRRSLRESAADTLAWLLSISGSRPVGNFTRAKEEAVIKESLA